jgi:DNA-binding response OmpR family regulator
MSKVLLVDDDVRSCELLEEFFQMKGHDVFMAYSDIQASEMVMSVKPDIILLDTTMLGKDSAEVLMCMRKSEHKVNIIILSSVKDIEIAKNALNMGADDYIKKPVNFALLEPKIISCLKKR